MIISTHTLIEQRTSLLLLNAALRSLAKSERVSYYSWYLYPASGIKMMTHPYSMYNNYNIMKLVGSPSLKFLVAYYSKTGFLKSHIRPHNPSIHMILYSSNVITTDLIANYNN